MQNKPLIEYHRECYQIDTTRIFQLNEIESSRRDLLQKMKETQEQRCFRSLRSGYCLRMTSNNVESGSKLPFIKPEGLRVSDHFSNPDIKKFIDLIYDHFTDLPSLLASISSEDLQEVQKDNEVRFLPEIVKPKEFLACSTLPALFGHCWSVELRYAYIDFLLNIIKKLPPTIFNEREHWIFECLKNYIHASNIHQFLKLSIADTMLQLVREDANKSPKLTNYCADMVSRMKENISSIPKDIRLLIKKIADLAPDQSQRTSRIECIFIDCILAPAISLPKAYCVLPPSFTLDMSSIGPSRTLQKLAQHFRLINHSVQAQLRNLSQEDVASLEKIPFSQFLNQIADIDETSLDKTGPQISQLMQLLHMDSTFLLFTTSDIYLLAKLLKSEAIDKTGVYPTHDVPFEFFRFEFKKVEVFGFQPPELFVNKVEKGSKGALSDAAAALFKFLTYVNIKEFESDDLNQLIRSYEIEAKLQQDFLMYTYINYLITKLKALNESQHCDILIELNEEIRRNYMYLDRNNAILTNISRMMQRLTAEINDCKEKAEQTYPIIYSALLTLFLDKNPNVKQSFEELKQQMLTNKKVFQDFFSETLVKLRDFITPIASYAITGVSTHYHSWLMQNMTLRDFIEYHPEYTDGDMRLTIVTKDVIQQVCVNPAPPKLSNIFANPPLFDFAVLELRASEFTEIPIEAMVFISSAINLIQRMFDLSIGGAPQADEMTPLFNYALLSSGFNTMLSFEKYIEHFLFELPQLDLKIINEQTSVALTHFINHVSSLDQIILSQV